MEQAERQQVLRGIELFADLSEEQLAWLAEQVEEQSYEEGEALFEENEPRRALGLIASGRVELGKKNERAELQRLAYFDPGDFLGEGSLLDDYPHATSARALEPTQVLLIPREKFASFFESAPEVAGHILARIARVMSRRLRHASTHVASAGEQYLSGRTRPEHDLLGDREVPAEAYYGVQTLRARENFSISGIPLYHHPELIVALGQVKQAAAKANGELGLLDEDLRDAILRACQEIVDGRLHTHFVVDLIQGGAGTSTNMNANEVIANRALELLGLERGSYDRCHPNTHVNMAQSTNDVYPTALKVAMLYANHSLVAVLEQLVASFRGKADEFAGIIKMGRTQLQDAVPMTLGQEFDAWGTTLAEEILRLNNIATLFHEVNLGGTAIGTGLNADPAYPELAVQHLAEITGLELELAENLVEATQDTGSFVMYSGALKRLAVKLSKIANDLRLLSSGPRAGLGEINLPPMQPGSSIMPGKVNPVIPEVVNQIAFKVIGNDLTVTLAAEGGQLELNVFEPVIVQSLLESIEMLKNGMATFRVRCVEGIAANADRCRDLALNSIGLVTALNPRLGYEASTRIAKQALESGRSVAELVLEEGLLSQEELDELLAPENMVGPRRLPRQGG